MHNRSESIRGRAIDAEIAQVLRSQQVFGAVLFYEGLALDADLVHLEPGYADCLPILGGGCYRSPETVDLTETTQ